MTGAGPRRFRPAAAPRGGGGGSPSAPPWGSRCSEKRWKKIDKKMKREKTVVPFFCVSFHTHIPPTFLPWRKILTFLRAPPSNWSERKRERTKNARGATLRERNERDDEKTRERGVFFSLSFLPLTTVAADHFFSNLFFFFVPPKTLTPRQTASPTPPFTRPFSKTPRHTITKNEKKISSFSLQAKPKQNTL